MTGRPLALLLAFLALACSEEDIRARGRLATPVALTVAPSTASGALGGRVLFVASADDEELRVFLPDSGLFVRGPNGISPLSIPAGFRPQALASGEVEGRGFAVAAGGEAALVTVSADTFRVTTAKGDEDACVNGRVAPSCMGAPVVDVGGAGSRIVAILVDASGGGGSLVSLSGRLEDDAPVLELEETFALDFKPEAVALSLDGGLAWIADADAARVTEVSLADGAKRVFETAGRVRRIVEVPGYTDAGGIARPAGVFLLALLVDGRVQTLDIASGGPASDPISPSDELSPLLIFSKRFGVPTPVRDLVFVPCDGEGCRTALRIKSGRIDEIPLLAVAALGDGTALPLVVDVKDPQIFRPIDLDESGPSVGDVSFVGKVSEEDAPSLAVDSSSLTSGLTRREKMTVTFEGILPRFDMRRGKVAGNELEDSMGGFDGLVRVGDLVSLRFLGAGCPEPVELEIASVADAMLGLAPGATAGGCSEVVYSVVARSDAPWTVVGSVSGYLGRTAVGESFKPELERFYYPEDAVSGPAFVFELSGAALPDRGATFTFSTDSGLSALTLNEDPEGRQIGLANGVAALPGLAFLAASGEDALVALTLDLQGLARGTVIFR